MDRFKDQLAEAQRYLESVSEPARQYRATDPDHAFAIQFEAESWTVRYVRQTFPEVADRILRKLNLTLAG